MKTKTLLAVVSSFFILHSSFLAGAATTINAVNKYAYGANLGWVNFETNGSPKVDLKTGKLSGSIYGANCGWISLNNAFAFVQTDTVAGGADSNANGMPDAWERGRISAPSESTRMPIPMAMA